MDYIDTDTALTVTEHRYLGADTLEIHFGTARPQPSAAGQYVQLQLADEWRVYSVASSVSKNTISILVKLLEGTPTTKVLRNLQIGDVIAARFLSDMPVLPHKNDNVMLVCTGTGIIPCYNLAKEVLEGAHGAKVFLLAGTRSEESMLLEEELELLTRIYDQFAYNYSLTAPMDDWTGYVGRLDIHLKKMTAYHNDALIYLAGYSEIVYSLKSHLEEVGVSRRNIHILGENLIKNA